VAAGGRREAGERSLRLGSCPAPPAVQRYCTMAGRWLNVARNRRQEVNSVTGEGAQAAGGGPQVSRRVLRFHSMHRSPSRAAASTG